GCGAAFGGPVADRAAGIGLPAVAETGGVGAAAGERPDAHTCHRRRRRNQLRRELLALDLESALATHPNRTPAVHGAVRESCARALLPRAHRADGRLQLNTGHADIRHGAAVARLSAVVGAPAVQCRIRSNGARVVVARRYRGPAERSEDALEKRAAARQIAELRVTVASPAVRFVRVGDTAGVRAAGADRAPAERCLDGFGRERAVERVWRSAAHGVALLRAKLAGLVAPPAIRDAARLQTAGM